MVNNAGIAPETVGLAAVPGGIRVHETAITDFDNSIAINTRGVFLGCKYACAQFLKQEPHPTNSRGDRSRGWIINVSSTLGTVGFNGAPCYVTSKHGTVGLTKNVALDYARDRIHCNALCPSFIDTALLAPITNDKSSPLVPGLLATHPWGTLGTVEDMARAAVFLASDSAQWITGQALCVDGGYTAQ